MTVKKSLTLALSILISTFVFAQKNANIQGRIIDESDNAALVGATVQLIHLPDSAKLGTSSNELGKFVFEKAKRGTHLMIISYVGYQDFQKTIQVSAAQFDAGNIAIKPASVDLNGVEIVGKTPPVKQLGDTTQFNAGSFKVNPDANAEDLVAKMPGVSVEQGKVQAQGEDVKRVLVDGKPFFGDDPNAALRNLPAEMIDKIQIFDQQSEQSQFTGLDDGNAVKTMNIVTRGSMRQGQFGKIYAGYGAPENPYKAGLTYNNFKKSQRFTIIGQSNNINEQNFSAEDLVGVSGGGGGGMRGGGMRGGEGGGPRGGGGNSGGGNMQDFLVGQNKGLTTTHAFGINYSNKWKKLDFSGSYFFNFGDNETNNVLFRQYLIPTDANQTYSENNTTNSKNMNHRINLRFEYQIDSLNSLMFRPRFSLQNNNGSSKVNALTSVPARTLNVLNTASNSDLDGYNFNNEILFRHRFAKRGRTISLGGNVGFNGNTGDSDLISESAFYALPNNIRDTLDQVSDLLQNGWSGSANITYTEPITAKSLLSISYNGSNTFTDSDKETYHFLNSSNAYSLLDTTASNVFESTYWTHSGGLSYRFQEKKYNFTLGVNYQWSDLNNLQVFPTQSNPRRTLDAILPNAMFQYRVGTKHNLMVNYRSRSQAPSISQLQEVLNNSNPLQLSIGNADLKQNNQHTLSARYSTANAAKGTNFFAMLNASFSDNYIGNNTVLATENMLWNNIPLLRGTQITQPINLEGQYSLRSFLVYGLPFKAIKSNLNFNASASYSRTPSQTNEVVSFTKNTALGAMIVLSSNISKDVDFTLSSNSTWNNSLNTFNDTKTSYFNENARARVNIQFLKNWVFQTDLSYQFYNGLSDGFNQNYTLWNAAIAKKFFKNNLGELRLSVFDILGQNNALQRTSNDYYIEDAISNTLETYMMLTFTYNLRKLTAGNFNNNNPERREQRPPMMMPF